jgi:ADP-ribosylation factor-binding protein GGA
MFDFRSNTSTPNQNATKRPVPTDEDEWAFESALPENNELPSSNLITLTDSVIIITAEVSRKSSSDPAITLSFKYSNKTPMPVSELTFQAAVSKV